MENLTKKELIEVNGGNAPGLMGHIVAVGESFWSFASSFVDGFINGSEDVIEQHMD